MTANRGQRTAADGRELRLWKVGWALTVIFTAAILAAGSVFYSLIALLDFQEIDTTAKLDAKTLFDIVTLSFGVVAGAGALVALVVAYRRQRVDEAGAHREATRLHTERFSQAVDKLGSDSPAVRLGGVHALAGLADDAPDDSLRQTCIDVLCAYLQLPYTPDPGTDPAHQGEHHRYLALRKVRHTILRIIGDHYRRPRGTHRSWQGCDLDLTGIIIDGDVSLDGATFSGGNVSFNGATFSGGNVSFNGATFSGGVVSFDDATFSGSYVSLARARFSGGIVSFHGATFSGSDVYLPSTTFSGGIVSFDSAAFSGGNVSLASATFSGSAVSFDHAAFCGSMMSFSGMKLSSGEMSFNYASFSSGPVSFADATFSGGEISFNSATFSSSTTYFTGATFSNGALSFVDVTGPPLRGLLDAVGVPVPATVTLPVSWHPSEPHPPGG
ncbi:pentapeptide repeat-containing protein [Streptomyces sp. MBT60]|uniref:pentapeptide repeat-containing protein n=1 Tax=Streptomyces sp. MBT60 TaxID=2800409 RepID=UPI00190CAED5|nr:pentapeptide repeat-containing protein [Streptomyces sp. MBT60]MBK3544857.1 pentapeptide repeat-containing protein [Streptomyces sp. MBT60]